MKTQITTLILICISIITYSQSSTFNEKIMAPDGSFNDRFGWAVDVQGDILVGGDIFDGTVSEPNTGAAYVFRKNSSGNFIFEQKLKAPFLESYDNYASEVEINGDFIAVGAPRYKYNDSANGFPTVESAGAVFLYKYNSAINQWELVNQIFAPTRQLNHLFGFRVYLTNNQIFISEIEHRYTNVNALRSGKIHVYNYDNNGNVTYNQGIDNPEPSSNDFFGSEISLFGNTLAIGARGEKEDANGNNTLNFAGAVYVFESNNMGQFILQQKIVPSTRFAYADFGDGLDIDDSTLVVGASSETRVQPGTSNTADCGIVYIFKKVNNTWSQTEIVEPPNVEFNAGYGASINLIENTALISYKGGRVPYNGSTIASGLVEELNIDSNGNIDNRYVIPPPFPDSTNEFGYITSWDGNQLAVGAYADRGDINGSIIPEGSPGAVYIYNLSNSLSTTSSTFHNIRILNPVENTINIYGLENDGTYRLFDLQGKTIAEGKLTHVDPHIDIFNLAKGIYLLNIKVESSVQNFKVLKK